MKKITVLILLLIITSQSYLLAQIRQLSKDDAEKTYQQQVDEPKPFNDDKPTYDSLSNWLTNYKDIIGQQIYFPGTKELYLTELLKEDVDIAVSVKQIDYDKMVIQSKGTRVNLNSIPLKNEKISKPLRAIKCSSTQEYTDCYFTIVDIVTKDHQNYDSYFKRLYFDPKDYLSCSSLKGEPVIVDNKTNKKATLTVDENGDLVTYAVIGFNNKPQKGVLHKDYYEAMMGAHYLRIETTALDLDKPILEKSSVKNIYTHKDKPIFVLVEQQSQYTLLSLADLGGSIGLAYYNKMVDLHKDRKFISNNGGKDLYIYNMLIKEATRVCIKPTDTLVCEDIILFDKKLTALMSNGTEEFGMSVSSTKLLEVANYTYENRIDVKVDIPTTYCALDKMQPIEFAEASNLHRQKIRSAIDEYEVQQKLAQKEKNEQWQREFEQQEKERKASLVAKYGQQYGESIFNRKVMLGMSPEMARVAWGNPTKKLIESNHEVWYYYGGLLNAELRGRLTFSHNKLIEIYGN